MNVVFEAVHGISPLNVLSRVTRDILPEGIGGGVNSQVPRQLFYGEGPELASGEESVKQSGKGVAVAEGREGFSRIPNGRIDCDETKETMLQLEMFIGLSVS
jgi:hypothetical protein